MAEIKLRRDTAPITPSPVVSPTQQPKHAPERHIMPSIAPIAIHPQKQPQTAAFHVGNKCFAAFDGAWTARQNNDPERAAKHLVSCKNTPILEQVAATQKVAPNSTKQDWLDLLQWIINRAPDKTKKLLTEYFKPLRQALMPKNRAPIAKTTTPKIPAASRFI